MKITIDIPDTSPSGLFFNEQTYRNPCERCMNNPKNNPNASGMCNCALPYMNGPSKITCNTTADYPYLGSSWTYTGDSYQVYLGGD